MLDVRFAPGRILQPDAMVFIAPLPLKTKTPIQRLPELAIEVLSSNRTYDRIAKRSIYGSAGVREYWLVDTLKSQLEICHGEALMLTRLEAARLTTPLLPGFALDVPGLFADA